jgi:hypothetical protein
MNESDISNFLLEQIAKYTISLKRRQHENS